MIKREGVQAKGIILKESEREREEKAIKGEREREREREIDR